MRLSDVQYTRTSVYGILRMTDYLCRLGHEVCFSSLLVKCLYGALARLTLEAGHEAEA